MPTLRSKLLKISDDAKKTLKVPFQVRKDRKALESWIIDVEEKIADLELKIEEAKGASNFNVDKILDAIDDLELANRRLVQGNALLKELFTEEDTKEE